MEEIVYRAVRTESLRKTDYVSVFKGLINSLESIYRAIRTEPLYKTDYFRSLKGLSTP
jgi:hypothetical protein